MKGPALVNGTLCTEQDSLPGGISRENSMCERHKADNVKTLTAAVRDDWVPACEGLSSHPLADHVAGQAHEPEEELVADIEDEFEGVCAGNASSDEYSDVGEEAGSGDTEVVFVKEGVCMFPSASRRQRIMGRLSLIKQYNCLFICWLPYTAGAIAAESSGSCGDGASADSAADSARDRTLYAVHPIPLSDVRAIHKHTPPLGQHRVTLTLASGVSLPSLHFLHGGVKAFLSCLRQHTPLVRCDEDPSIYLVNDIQDPLQRSLCSLELTEALAGSQAPGASLAPFAGTLAVTNWQGPDGDTGLRAQLAELVDRFQQLTQSARDTASSLLGRSALLCTNGPPQLQFQPPAWATGPTTPAADLGRRRSSLEASTELGVFELIEEAAGAGTEAHQAWARARPPPLTLDELATFLDADGRLTNIPAFRARVYAGGVAPDARPEAWKLLLGLHAPDSTRQERQAGVEARRAGYQRVRSQWRSMAPAQQARCSKWRERRVRIDKDVRRTDRGHRFFARERSQAQAMLRNVLLTYERYNQDQGYVQGMSDLAAPCLYVMRSAVPDGGQLSNADALAVEAEAFWCFAALMERMEHNFSSDSRAMHAQLEALKALVRLLDPPLYSHLEAHDCLSFFFCYRWLLILFKREFAFDEVLRLWEALWAGAPGLHLYLCVAALEHHRRRILSEAWDLDGMLKFCIELAGRLKLEPLLRDAELLASFAGEGGREIVEAALKACAPSTAV